MKNKLEITAYHIKSGVEREIVALELDKKCPAQDFLLDLKANNPKGFQILSTQLRVICESRVIRNRDRFKLLDASRQLYEVKTRSGLRLYCFVVTIQVSNSKVSASFVEVRIV